MAFAPKQYSKQAMQRPENQVAANAYREEDVVQSQFENPHPDKNVESARVAIQRSFDKKGGAEGFGAVQAKLTIGRPNDKYEREADETADLVMSPSRIAPPMTKAERSVQMQEFLQAVRWDSSTKSGAGYENSKDKIRRNEFIQSEMDRNAAQPKVSENRGGGISMSEFIQAELEQNAIQRSKNGPDPRTMLNKQEMIQRVIDGDSSEGDSEMINAKFQFPKIPNASSAKKPDTAPPTKPVAKGVESKGKGGKEEASLGKIDVAKPAKPEKSKAKPPKVQKREEEVNPKGESDTGDSMASSTFEVSLNGTKGSGQKLPKALRKEMEVRFGHSFKAVRIHVSAEAARLCKEIGARAFAHGSDIYFNTGQFNPDSEDGKRLLAHELTHTIQQGANAESSIQREPFNPTGTEPKTESKPPEINDGEEVKDAGDDFMEGHDNYDADNVDKPVSEMDEDEKEQMNATSGESKEEQSEVETAGVNKPKADRGGDALKKTTTQKEQIDNKDKEKENEEKGEEKEEKEGDKKLSPAEEAAVRSKEALQRAEELKDPKAFSEFKDPRVEKPVDNEGNYLPGDKDVDTLVLGLAYLGRAFREHAFELIKYSIAQGKKAYSIDAVLEKQREDLANSEELTATADEHSIQYKEGTELGAGAKKESDVREGFTTDKTPGIKAIADDSMADSKSIASDTEGQAKKHTSNLPKDADARKDAEEQGSDMGDMAKGALTILEAFILANLSLETYLLDAIFAKEKNAEGQGQLDEANASIAAYDEQNQTLKDGNDQTKEQLAQVEFAPEDMRQRAASTKDGGYELYAATVVMEVELIDIQEKYLNKMKTVRSVRQLDEEEKVKSKEKAKEQDRSFTQDEMMVIAMSGMGQTEQEEFVEDLPEGKEADLNKAVDGLESLTGNQDEKDAWVKKDEGIANELLGQKRERFDTGFNKAVGLEKQDPRQAEFGPIEEERKQRLGKPMDIADKNMTVLSYKEKEMIAGNLVTDTTINDVQNMVTWENAGNMVKGMVDPRMMISGVFGGFEKIGNGIVNFSEHWKEDPVGAVLKAGADIATGIATIASTVLGICAAISAVLLAITIFGWMFPSPITVPSMTWMGTVMSISGYTAMIAGTLSFRLNQLMYQRNLHQAASATTAREFLGNALEMKENVADGAVGLMSIAAGYGGVKMGPGFDMKNVVRGFKTPKRALATMRSGWRGLKGLPKHLAGKGKNLVMNLVRGGKDVFKNLRDRIKALFSKKKNKPDVIDNNGPLNADGPPSVNDRTPDRVDDSPNDTNSDGQKSTDNDVANNDKKNDGEVTENDPPKTDEPAVTTTTTPTKKLTKKHKDYDAEIDRRANLPEGDPQKIDLETADELKRYNHSTQSGATRDIDSVIEDINDGKTLDPTTSRYSDPNPNVSKRKEYVGETPGKDSTTGKAVIERMYNEKPPRIRNYPPRGSDTEFYDSVNKKWYSLDDADMGHHPKSAVEYWNTEGKYHGPKSDDVRNWMKNSDNYELQYYSRNRSEGASLGMTYDPPIIK